MSLLATSIALQLALAATPVDAPACGAPTWRDAPAWVCRGTGAARQRERLIVGVSSIEIRTTVEDANGWAAARAVHELWRAWASYSNLLSLEAHGRVLVQGEEWAPPPWPDTGTPFSPDTRFEYWVPPEGGRVFASASVPIDAVLAHLAQHIRPERAAAARARAEAVHDSLLRRHDAKDAPTKSRSARSVTVAPLHACAVIKGEVACWGGNEMGQLGQAWPSKVQVPVPRAVPGLAAVDGVSAGTDFTCAWTSAGQVFCWGLGHLGQLGYTPGGSCEGPVNPSLPCSNKPQALALSDVVQVASGHTHACALGRDGRVRCWGAAEYGQLGAVPTERCVVAGKGSSWSAPCSHAPMEVQGLADVTQLSAGADHTCARTSAGKVMCWGNNAFGQLGPLQAYDCPLRSGEKCTHRPSRVYGLADAAGLVAGDRFSCAWRSDGSAWCWGDNSRAQLGAAPSEQCTPANYQGCERGPKAIEGLGDVVGMCAGIRHACAFDRAGALSCWGAPPVALGFREPQACDTTGCGQAPRVVRFVSARQIDCDFTSCAVGQNGEVACWGRNLGGNVGDGTIIERTTPFRVGL